MRLILIDTNRNNSSNISSLIEVSFSFYRHSFCSQWPRSERYASYWNGYLFLFFFVSTWFASTWVDFSSFVLMYCIRLLFQFISLKCITKIKRIVSFFVLQRKWQLNVKLYSKTKNPTAFLKTSTRGSKGACISKYLIQKWCTTVSKFVNCTKILHRMCQR